jgi:hypothetical protein
MTNDHRTKSRTRKAGKTAAKTMMTSAAKGDSLPANDMIGRKLREYYDEVAKEPVPDRFKALLDALESQSAGKKTS